MNKSLLMRFCCGRFLAAFLLAAAGSAPALASWYELVDGSSGVIEDFEPYKKPDKKDRLQQQGLLAAALRTANPDALPLAQRILTFFESLPSRSGNRVVSGQFIGHPQADMRPAYNKYIGDLKSQTGQWVGMAGADYARLAAANDPVDLSAVNLPLIEHWNQGGLVTISWHARNPWTGGNSRDQTVNGSFLDLFTPGTAANQAWMQQLDQVADALEQLQQAGVIVLWRPFHEANGKSFWWAQPRTTEEQVTLWREMFRYFTTERHLNNLLWVYSVVTERSDKIRPALAAYPGNEYVDVVGVDIYNSKLPISKEYEAFRSLGKPMGLTEFGPFKGNDSKAFTYDYSKLIQKIRKNYPRITFFQAWNSVWSMIQQLNAEKLLKDPWVANRPELDF